MNISFPEPGQGWRSRQRCLKRVWVAWEKPALEGQGEREAAGRQEEEWGAGRTSWLDGSVEQDPGTLEYSGSVKRWV